ncbi:MAG TPA: DUF3419 family protein, partial [Pyrinomonadaceae bacterium]|nr:DUF3419 family protein [Pyrinomonadaceae bacterium]
IYLLDLKIAALQHLPAYEDFFTFFGCGKGEDTGELYTKYIAPNLPPATREFWESNTIGGRLWYGKRIGFFRTRGLYDHSRNGYFLRFFHRFAHLIGCWPEKLTEAATLEEQNAIFEQHIGRFFDTFIIKTIGKMPVTMFGLGIPPQQYDELKRELGRGQTIIDLYRERVRHLACDFPIQENYFAWQAFARKYDTETRIAIPDYLKPENYEILKRNLNRLRTNIGSATDEITSSPRGTFNRFVFLDAQDWMDAEGIADLWAAVADRGEPESRIIFRTAGSASPLETNLPPALLERFHYERDISAELFKRDRASIYGGFHLYILKK